MKKRKDLFFGVHIDETIDEKDSKTGIYFDKSVVARICSEIKPDFIQADAKGWKGLSCYPTKVGISAAEVQNNVLKGWCDTAAEYGIPVYAHFCSIVNRETGKIHPEWAAVEMESGSDRADCFHNSYMSLYGPYVDEQLIPQMKEIASYGCNGIWVDAESWAVRLDTSKWAAAAYKKESGNDIPLSRDDPDFEVYLAWIRRGFKDYICKYIAEVKKDYPEFEICSNYTVGSALPEKDLPPLDFASYDLTSVNPLYCIRYEARLMKNRGIPWDLMSWGFRYGHPRNYYALKTPVMLNQEAAAVIMLGGAFQVYHNMQIYKTICWEEQYFPVMKEVAAFVRAREKWCFKTEIVQDIGIVVSALNHYTVKKRPYVYPNDGYEHSVRGLIDIALDCAHSVEAVLTHQTQDLHKFDALILGDMEVIEPLLKQELLKYAENGGRLVITGAGTFELFKEVFDPVYEENVTWCKGEEFSLYSHSCASEIKSRKVKLKSFKGETVEFGRLGEKSMYPADIPAVIRNKHGKGSITAITFDIGKDYYRGKNVVSRDVMLKALNISLPRAWTDNGFYVDVNLTEKNGVRMMNLLNMLGEHNDEKVLNFDFIPSITDLKFSFECHYKPSAVTQEPEGKPLEFEYKNKRVSGKIDRLDIHSIIVAHKQVKGGEK